MGLELLKKAPYRFDNALRPILKTLEKSLDKFLSYLDSSAKVYFASAESSILFQQLPPPETKEDSQRILPAIVNRAKYGTEQRQRDLSKAQSDKKENRLIIPEKKVKV
jgi:hypothetical protein